MQDRSPSSGYKVRSRTLRTSGRKRNFFLTYRPTFLQSRIWDIQKHLLNDCVCRGNQRSKCQNLLTAVKEYLPAVSIFIVQFGCNSVYVDLYVMCRVGHTLHISVTVKNAFVISVYYDKEQTICSLVNPLNPELNPICYLLALLGAHHFLHVSRIRDKLLTFRLLMSYIHIWSTHS